ncbi:MAG: diguanylate cyclase, partial [Dokdonella sp.]
MRAELGPDIVLARCGGEEFVVIIEGESLASTMAIAERVRGGVERALLSLRAGDETGTISVGAASLANLLKPSFDSLLDAADQALYRAKAAGRNRVVGAVSDVLAET